MSHEVYNSSLDELAQEYQAVDRGTPLIETIDGELRELWRVVSADGSTRIFQTRPTGEARPGKRTPTRRAVPCRLDGETPAAGSAIFGRDDSALPPLVTETAPAAQTAAESELSAELTSVTQAWPTLSPGIRGAVMALIRAASNGRPTRPGVSPATPRR